MTSWYKCTFSIFFALRKDVITIQTVINCLSTRLNGKAPYSTINWHGLKSIRYVPVYRMFIMIETQIILHGNITLNEQGELQYAKSAQYLLEKPASSSDSLLRKVSVLFFILKLGVVNMDWVIMH